MNRAIFLDRDGLINKDNEYISTIDNFEFIPRTIDALKKASQSNYKLIIITNQSGIGRGYYTIEDYKKVEKYMLDYFEKNNIKIDKVFFCPHNIDEGCECRKPKTKFFMQSQKEFNIDLTQSFMIGDKTADIKAGHDAGCKTILVKTGKAGKDNTYDIKPNFIAQDLYSAISLILEDKK
jgi:D-glycero-D-manno-heptose 1,7-bisphosphate phosphatase